MKIPTYAQYQNDEYYQTQLSQALAAGLSDNGLTVPQQTTTNINSLVSMMPSGTLWYDTDTDSLKVNINGVVKTVTVS